MSFEAASIDAPCENCGERWDDHEADDNGQEPVCPGAK